MAAERSHKDPLDYLSVRFHYRGTFEWRGKEWIWLGGRYGMSTVPLSMLSVPELKKHLADHVCISEQAMEKTELCWKMPAGPIKSAVILLHDKRSVQTMAKYVSDAGVIDIYAKIPADLAPADNSDTEGEQIQVENAALEYDFQREYGAEQIADEQSAEQNHEQNHEYSQWDNNAQQDEDAKLPVFRANVDLKGKGIKVDTAEEVVYSDDNDDSDYNDAHEEDESNSSADDEEAISYRHQANELKKKVRQNMLGDEEFKTCKVPEEFTRPDNIQDDGEEPCFDTEDELSYDEDTDNEEKDPN